MTVSKEKPHSNIVLSSAKLQKIVSTINKKKSLIKMLRNLKLIPANYSHFLQFSFSLLLSAIDQS